MSIYLNKSRANLAVADSLINEECRVASAHSAYYSLFLLAKFLLNARFGVGYDEQESICKNKESHKVIKNLLITKLGQIKDFEPNDLFQWYNLVQMMRNKADYKPATLSDTQLNVNLCNAHLYVDAINSQFNLY